MSSRIEITKSTGAYSDNLQKLKQVLSESDAVVIGAGAGLSTPVDGGTYKLNIQ